MQQAETILEYEFSNKALLEEAMTHPSCSKHVAGHDSHYQRMEFLGDSILGAVISDLLFRRYPDEAEGKLAQRKSALVCGDTLAKVMDQLGLMPFIVMSDGEAASGGRESKSIKEDICEAVIGALYLDAGYDKAYGFVEKWWGDLVESQLEAPKDPKTALQELVQGRGLPLPVYEVLDRKGAAHEPIFTVAVSVEGIDHAQQASARSKREAERLAAAEMLKVLG